MPAETDLKTYHEFTDMQKALVDLYTDPSSKTYKNKVQSYIAAGYYVGAPPEGQEDDGRGYRAARQYAHKIFILPHIKAEVEKRLEANREAINMAIPDIVDKLSTISEANLMDYMVQQECRCPHCDGDISSLVQEYQFDIERMRNDGYGIILKKMKPTRYGTEFEFHDPIATMDRLMKHYGGYKSSDAGADLSVFDELVIAARKK